MTAALAAHEKINRIALPSDLTTQSTFLSSCRPLRWSAAEGHIGRTTGDVAILQRQENRFPLRATASG
jgi:hypothetical protein